MMDIRDILESDDFKRSDKLHEFFIHNYHGSLNNGLPYQAVYFDDEDGFSKILDREMKIRNSSFSNRLLEDIEFDLGIMIESHKKWHDGRNADILVLADRFLIFLKGLAAGHHSEKETPESRNLEDIMIEPSKENFRKVMKILLLEDTEIHFDYLKPLIDNKMNWIGNKGAVQIFGEFLIKEKIVIENKKYKLGRILSNTFRGVKEKCMEQGKNEKYKAQEYQEYFGSTLGKLK